MNKAIQITNIAKECNRKLRKMFNCENYTDNDSIYIEVKK